MAMYVITIQPPYTMFELPANVLPISASEVCAKAPGMISTVSWYDFTTEHWTTHICGVPTTDFTVLPGMFLNIYLYGSEPVELSFDTTEEVPGPEIPEWVMPLLLVGGVAVLGLVLMSK